MTSMTPVVSGTVYRSQGVRGTGTAYSPFHSSLHETRTSTQDKSTETPEKGTYPVVLPLESDVRDVPIRTGPEVYKRPRGLHLHRGLREESEGMHPR